MEKITRNSNHELLRLVAMYMIVLMHANMYLGRFVREASEISAMVW